MSLLHPEFLLALFALIVPILIHLFNFKRFKRIIFPNVRFLKEVDLQTRSKNRLKHLLVLFSRMLAIAALVMAFARPFIPADVNEKVVKTHHVAVYVDNSFSMDLENESGNIRAQAVKLAEQIVSSYDANARFLLLTNDFKAEHQHLLSKDEFTEQVNSIGSSPASRAYSEIYARASDALQRADGDGRTLFYISDLQSKSFDPVNAQPDSIMTTRILSLEHAGQGNVYIDSLWFESPVRSTHSPERIGIRVVNASAKDLYDIPLRLSIDGTQRALGNMTLRPYTSVDSILTFSNSSSGWKQGEVSIKDYPITFDDALYFAYDVQKHCKVTVIGPAATRKSLGRIFANDPFFVLKQSEIGQVDIAGLRDQNFIVLAGVSSVSSGLTKELSRFVSEGGSLCYIPGKQVDRAAVNELLLSLSSNTIQGTIDKESKASRLDSDHPLFEDVFDQRPRNVGLPNVQRYLNFNDRVRSTEERIISLQDGSSLLSCYPMERGKSFIYASSTDAASSDLGAHSIFVTSLLRMAEMSAGSPVLYQTLGSDQAVELKLGQKPNDDVYRMERASDDMSFIPEQRTQGSQTLFFERGQIDQAGVYSITIADSLRAKAAYNFDRYESQMDFMTQADAQAELERSGFLNFSFIKTDSLSSGSFSAAVAGSPLWRYFIIAALLFLAIEVLLLKFWK